MRELQDATSERGTQLRPSHFDGLSRREHHKAAPASRRAADLTRPRRGHRVPEEESALAYFRCELLNSTHLCSLQANVLFSTKHNDVTVPKEDMPSLKISVATAKVTHYAEAARFSEYGDYEVLYEVTENRLAGANPGDI